MLIQDLLNLTIKSPSIPLPVTVIANDYRYDGWVVTVFSKRKSSIRCVVEDENGRLFIHNPHQLECREEHHAETSDIGDTVSGTHGSGILSVETKSSTYTGL